MISTKLTCLAVVLSLSATVVTPASQNPPEGTLQKPTPPRERKYKDFTRGVYNGTVSAVGSDYLLVLTDQPNAGIYADGEVLDAQGRPAVRFEASAMLAAGDYPRHLTDSYTYPLSDVRPGDKVMLQTRRVRGVDYVDGVVIYRRPGGRVPPSREQDPNSLYPGHEYCNAHQDWEEKRIPVPFKFAPSPWPIPGEKRPQLPPPYDYQYAPPPPPAAPMPRVVIPKIPPSQD